MAGDAAPGDAAKEPVFSKENRSNNAELKRPVVRDKGGALAHPLFRRAAELADSSVYESSPEKSTAAYSATARAAREETPTVYESRPQQSAAAAAAAAGYGETAAARALIEQAAAAAPTVFESQPQQRSADASFSVAGGESHGASCWESQPAASKADALHRGGTNDAAELIQSAAEQYSSGQNVVYENAPLASGAHACHGAAVQAETATVYESKPSASRADFVAGHVRHTDSARRLIEEAAAQAEQNQSPAQAQAARALATEAEQLIQQAFVEQAAGAGSFVYESKPLESSAYARHGQEGVASDEESEEEEEETSG